MKLNYVVIALASLALAGCETSDDKTLASGQACLDQATSATAQSCADIVAGLSSKEAAMIRCSANFVSQGLTGSRIANSISNLNSNGQVNGATNLMSFMIFKSATPTADTTVANCTAAGSLGMLRLATAAKLATSLATITGAISSIDPSSATAGQQLQTAIAALNPSTMTAADKQSLGNTAVTAASSYCGDGSSYAGTSVCTTLQNAVNSSSDPAVIGANLVTQLQNIH